MNASPFKFAYLVVFALAIASVFYDATCTFTTNAGDGFVVSHANINMRTFYGVLILAGAIGTVHMFRVYISLGILEHDQDFYDKYLKNLKSYQRRIEFILRCSLIWFVSLKLTPYGKIASIQSLGCMLFYVYGMMLVWDLLMVVFQSCWNWLFLGTSAAGFLEGIVLWNLKPDQEGQLVLPIAMAVLVFSIVKGCFLFVDFRQNRVRYAAYLKSICWVE